MPLILMIRAAQGAGTKQTSLICSTEPLIGQIIMKLYHHSLQLMVLKQFVVAVGFESRSYIDGGGKLTNSG